MTVDEALERLDQGSVQMLFLCFENEQTHFIVFDEDSFVGVFCDHLPNLIVESVEGSWSYGHTRK